MPLRATLGKLSRTLGFDDRVIHATKRSFTPGSQQQSHEQMKLPSYLGAGSNWGGNFWLFSAPMDGSVHFGTTDLGLPGLIHFGTTDLDLPV